MISTKQRLQRRIDDRREELIALCAELIRRPSPNPPGNTLAVAAYVRDVLERHGHHVTEYARNRDEPNLVARIGQASARPHLVLNGHMDVFPVEDEASWSFDPHSGAVHEGRIFGRGASDMKGGLAGLLFAFLLLGEEKVSFSGQVSFCAVSDEEDGGPDGLRWLMAEHPELVGDAALIGEPNSVDQVSIANKGVATLKLATQGVARHGGLGDGTDAIARLAEAIVALRQIVNVRVEPPIEMRDVLTRQIELDRTGADERHGLGWLADRYGITMSTFKGGLRSNVSPLRAEAVIDVRIPLNGSNDEAYNLVRETLLKAGRGDVEVSVFRETSDLNYPPHWTSPHDRLSQIVRRNVAEVRGQDPIFIVTFPSGDIRNYRLRGLPGVVYGTDPHNTGGFDEYITVDDLITVTKVYVGTILDYLGVDG